MSHLPLKRLIAALLPVAFSWLFVACLSSCARESVKHQEDTVASSAVGTQDDSDCEGCPLTAFPRATAPERAALKLELQAHALAPPLAPPLHTLAGEVSSVPRRLRPSSADPPLARLPILRI